MNLSSDIVGYDLNDRIYCVRCLDPRSLIESDQDNVLYLDREDTSDIIRCEECEGYLNEQ